MNDNLPKWFNINYEETRDFLRSPAKYSFVKIFQFLIQTFVLLMIKSFMLSKLMLKKSYNFITSNNGLLLTIIKIIRQLRMRLIIQ